MRRTTYLLACLLLCLVTLTAATPPYIPAQTNDWDSIPTAEPAPPTMRYQPPAEAKSMAELLPPTAERVVVDAAVATLTNTPAEATSRTSPTAIPLTPKQDSVYLLADTIGLYVEQESFPNGGQLLVEQISQRTVAPIAQLDPTTEPPTSTLDLPSVTPLVEFALEAVDEQGQPITFTHPVLFVLDMTEYGYDLSEEGGEFYIAYEDPDEPGTWRDIPTTLHSNTGLISGQTDHFSNWVGGWRPSAWSLSWQPPVASEFSGTSNYSFPINVPPGQAGLQPSLGLSYSSGGIRGAVRQAGNGPIAAGWSLSDISISRTGFGQAPDGPHAVDHFRMTINGTGYRLIQAGPPSGGNTRF
ncbi:MAG: SpvB/TcaC N-terminal domain-containing protein [Chloroflexi bacterium]|nr:SpvB/TcaC N-terminal domain-containing protein [Chloroflexota bacterium]